MIDAERERLKEKLANPMKDPLERERLVGQCMALEAIRDKVSEQIKSGDSDDADNPPPKPPERPSYK